MKILMVLSFVACSWATSVRQCNPDNPIKDLSKRVELDNCPKFPCRLKKDTFFNLSLRFTPDRNITSLKNRVTAEILGAQLPFVGVDGEDACGYVYNTDGSKVGKCNLKAGQDYIFKNGYEILRLYPTLKTIVHWALVTPDGKEILCFEVPVKITS